MALAAALGALAMGQLVVLPGLEAQTSLVDANLVTRLGQALHLRSVEIALVGAVVLVGTAPRWLGSRLATTLALLAVAGTGSLRLALLPDVYQAWARVDRVAGLPLDRLTQAQSLAEQAQWVAFGSIGALLALAVLAGLRWRPARPPRRATLDTPTLSDEATTTCEEPVANAA